jgi:hypothetical protein
LTVIIAGRVRWAHVGGVFADDVANRHLVLDHLVVGLLLGDGTKVLVGPGVRSDLVAVVVHLLDDACPVLVNCTLADVVTRNEESGVASSCLELAHNIFSVDVWAIVVGDCHGPGVVANVDATSAVGNTSKLGAGIIAGACSSRSLIGVCSTISNMTAVVETPNDIPQAGP